ncbi:MAG: RNA polymerase sigma factor [Hyphomicrobium sp.]
MQIGPRYWCVPQLAKAAVNRLETDGAGCATFSTVSGIAVEARRSTGHRFDGWAWAMTPDVRNEMVELLPRMRRFACTLTGSRDEADDVVQTACERALSRMHQFTPGTRLDSWLFQIVRTVWIDRVRYRSRRQTVNDMDLAESVGFDARVHEQTAARMDLAVVRQEIAKLPEDQRIILGLVTVDGMSYQEAAEMLDIPIGTVMSRLARARRKLVDALNGELRQENGEAKQQGPLT